MYRQGTIEYNMHNMGNPIKLLLHVSYSPLIIKFSAYQFLLKVVVNHQLPGESRVHAYDICIHMYMYMDTCILCTIVLSNALKS